MKQSKTKSTTVQVNDRITRDKPITYHYWLERHFEGWAEDAGWQPERLRSATESAIRNRHHEAFFEYECHKAHGRQPDIYTLDIGTVNIHYTVESDAVVVRGYSWTADESGEGGGLFTEDYWQNP